jgi:hypothetical protein
MKYCVATCHQGTDFGVFIAGPEDEQLPLEEAKALANSHGRGHYRFDCTVDEYWGQEDEENTHA